MKHLDAPRAVAFGAALVLAVNAWVLRAAAWNRSGEPDARLVLTERELAMPLERDPEDTGLVLSVVVADRAPERVERLARVGDRRLPPLRHPWLDAGKLRELGFDPSALEARAREDGEHPAGTARETRAAFVALEYDGEAWRAWLRGREEEVAALRAAVERGEAERGTLTDAEALLSLDRTERSRLMPVDAGLDAGALRSRHADRGRYAVVPAYVEARASRNAQGAVELLGRVDRLAVGGLAVPRRWIAVLAPFLPKPVTDDHRRLLREEAAAKRWPQAVPPRYRATVCWGRALDPWLAEITP